MKYALVNPNWSFDGSIYFGCRAPHLPLELAYSQALLEQAGHETLLVDAALEDLDRAALRRRVAEFGPHFTVLPTAPSYLFWRCPPPELRVPQETLALLRGVAGRTVIVGPHASTTPRATLRKLGADAAVLGECEATLPRLAEPDWSAIEGLAYPQGEHVRVQGGPQMADLATLPALHWPTALIRRHGHHHHRFDEPQHGFGAEVEASRGCPYSCSFCAKTDHRDGFRWRPLAVLLEEIDGLVEQGVGYLYFIDEIFMPKRELLEALVERPVQFGIQTRIDLWKPELLDLLGARRLRVHRGGRGEHQPGRPRRLEQELSRVHRGAARSPAARASYGALRAGQSARLAGRRRRAGRGLAPGAHCPRRVGEQAGADVSLPRLARLRAPVGPARRARLGAGGGLLPGAFRRVQRHPGRGAAPGPRAGAQRGAPVIGTGRLRRVLMSADTVGGVWTYAIDLARALREQGVQTVLATMGAAPSAVQRRQARRVRGLKLCESEFRLEWMDAPWGDVERAGEWLLGLERRYAPDLVHLNQYAFGALPWRSPVVLVGHSCVLSWWESVLGERAPHAYDLYRRRVGDGLRGADVVVAPSRTMLDALGRLYGGFGRAAVIHNGRDARVYATAAKEPYVLSAGRLWDAAKNIGTVMDAAPTLQWPVYLAGEAQHPDGGAFSLERVHALGHMAPEPLAEWYARASVYAFPARYEPFGLSVLEAAMSGCALVLGDIPSLRELWHEAALFVPPDDSAALAATVNDLIAHGRRRAGLMRRARNRARRYSLQRMAAEYLALYGTLLEGAPAAPDRTAVGSA